jgi:hypothetical protein
MNAKVLRNFSNRLDPDSVLFNFWIKLFYNKKCFVIFESNGKHYVNYKNILVDGWLGTEW